jgi:hypothetical protein
VCVVHALASAEPNFASLTHVPTRCHRAMISNGEGYCFRCIVTRTLTIGDTEGEALLRLLMPASVID